MTYIIKNNKIEKVKLVEEREESRTSKGWIDEYYLKDKVFYVDDGVKIFKVDTIYKKKIDALEELVGEITDKQEPIEEGWDEEKWKEFYKEYSHLVHGQPEPIEEDEVKPSVGMSTTEIMFILFLCLAFVFGGFEIISLSIDGFIRVFS